MPSPYSSSGTQQRRARARRGARRASCTSCRSSRAMDAYDADARASAFAGRAPDLTEENLQARIRGNLLMALSNKFGWLVLTTGNKSEMSVGYTTLYGDLAGGFAVIKDVPKTLVYRLCEWRNSPAGAAPRRRAGARARADPASIIERAPSAELRPDQRDEDSLPPYERARPDPRGLRRARPQPRAADRRRACPSSDVDRAIRLVDLAEYKRRQAPPGIKITDARVRARPPHADHQPLPRLRPPRRLRGARLRVRRARAAARCSPRWRARRSRRAATRCRTSRSRTTSLESADRRAVPRLLARRRLPGHADHRSARTTPAARSRVQYGDCLQGGQGTCVPPLRIVTSPDNSFLPGGSAPQRGRRDARRARACSRRRAARSRSRPAAWS